MCSFWCVIYKSAKPNFLKGKRGSDVGSMIVRDVPKSLPLKHE